MDSGRLLGFLGLLLTPVPFAFYFYGQWTFSQKSDTFADLAQGGEFGHGVALPFGIEDIDIISTVLT